MVIVRLTELFYVEFGYSYERFAFHGQPGSIRVWLLVVYGLTQCLLHGVIYVILYVYQNLSEYDCGSFQSTSRTMTMFTSC